MRGTTHTLLAVASGVITAFSADAQLSNPIPAPLTKGTTTVELVEVASGLVAPNLLIHAGDGSGRRFIVDQSGEVWVLTAHGAPLGGPFIDVSEDIPFLSSFDERGLLGLAFHPGFADLTSPGYRCVYTYHSEPFGPESADFGPSVSSGTNHRSVITEWKVAQLADNTVDTGSRRVVMRIDQPQSNHNAGMIAFDTSGMLLIALGDGGSAGDSGGGHTPGTGNGQDATTVLGSFLRIDPTGTSGSTSTNGQYSIPADNYWVVNPEVGVPDETFAIGFRNPFRFSVDTLTGDIIAGDVGQGDIEEVSIVTSGGNYGWRLKEGSFIYVPSLGGVVEDTNPDPNLIDPVIEYDHDEGNSVIGGFVYRGVRNPTLAGRYVFGDYGGNGAQSRGRLFAGDLATGAIEELTITSEDLDVPVYVKGFGRDAEGELYLLGSESLFFGGSSGRVFRIASPCEPDLTTTGATLEGQPGFGEPDGAVDLDDLGYFLGFFLVSDPEADVTTTGATLSGQPGFGVSDGVVDLDDLGYFLGVWLTGCA
ncbi:MAG: PQQ-dependent sugar dehydrogenase [Planctomycetota bacterium]